jgi:formamidopyrimidine-DNA glycosylase
MTGRLSFESTPEPARSHTHLIFNLDAPGSWLHFSDPRRFGKLRLITNRESDAISELGPDPLEISADEFWDRLRGRRSMLKALLLDQRFLRGLGNIYADESLFRAGIHPAAIAARLSRERSMRLYKGIRETLAQAIELGGSSISSYVDAQGRQGSFQQVHQVYQRTGEPCFRCGAPIRRMVIASRSTHFCSRCQTGRSRHHAAPFRKGARKRIK